jgi:hypothetical protein
MQLECDTPRLVSTKILLGPQTIANAALSPEITELGT